MDISLSDGRLKGYRQFINKIWNVSRFVLMNLPTDVAVRPDIPKLDSLDLVHRWILHRLRDVTSEVDEALNEFRFDVAADRLYHFVWHEYADWYIELIKAPLQARGRERDHAVAVLLEVHDQILRLLHPFIPFVTEEIWQSLPQRPGDGTRTDENQATITLAAFPRPRSEWRDTTAVSTMALLQEVVTSIRTLRSELGVPTSRKVCAIIESASKDDEGLLKASREQLSRLAGLEKLEFFDNVRPDPDTVKRVVRNFRVHVPLAGVVDRGKEIERVKRDLAKLSKLSLIHI